ncbi:MAG: hypothetical protein ABEH64_13130 [Salinirussus sp.]
MINRLYYAAFHAVQAVLYDRGFEPTSHGGVLSLFGSEIIAAGDAPRRTAASSVNFRSSDSRPTTATTNLMRMSTRSSHEPSNSSMTWKTSVRRRTRETVAAPFAGHSWTSAEHQSASVDGSQPPYARICALRSAHAPDSIVSRSRESAV